MPIFYVFFSVYVEKTDFHSIPLKDGHGRHSVDLQFFFFFYFFFFKLLLNHHQG